MQSWRYEIVIEGELDPRLAGGFAPMQVVTQEDTTTIIGDVRDQSELKGRLDMVASLGLSLMSVKRLPLG